MKCVVLIDAKAKLDGFAIAEPETAVVVVSLEIELWRPLEGQGQCLGGHKAMQRQIAFVLIPFEAADKIHARSLLNETQGHHATAGPFAGGVAILDRYPAVSMERFANLLKDLIVHL